MLGASMHLHLTSSATGTCRAPTWALAALPYEGIWSTSQDERSEAQWLKVAASYIHGP